ncbi:spore coat U domain-containing protein [Paraburkholderia mimosarum]|uniref:Csu type fimbrial protein n=1 Tax=Paraburkholderia mimosarum TaxID=312026 RepID=UPI0009E012BF|nr:spore coat U domain-containing protein [Paraburkholderia mimosarum]
MKNKIRRITATIAVALTMIASHANADIASGSVQVGAALLPTCQLTGGSLNFGAIAVGAAPTNSVGSIQVKCNGAAYDLKFSEGSSGNQLQRRMVGTTLSDSLQYNIYTDATYSVVVGDGTNGTSHPLSGKAGIQNIVNGKAGLTDAYTGGLMVKRWDLYGQVPGNQFVSPDNYTDNLVVTVVY